MVQSHLPSFQYLGNFINPHLLMCLLEKTHLLLEETLKAGGPFYLVSMPGEVKDPILVNV